MKNIENLLRLLKCRFGRGRIYTGYENDFEFTNTLKEYLDGYFNTKVGVQIQKKDIELEMLRYIRESLIIDIDATEYYVSNPTIVTVEKQLRGYDLRVRIRGLCLDKMLRLAELAHKLVESQDDINYPLG